MRQHTFCGLDTLPRLWHNHSRNTAPSFNG